MEVHLTEELGSQLMDFATREGLNTLALDTLGLDR